MKVAESAAFLSANPGAADLFARVIKHCEANGASGKLAGECQDGLPVSVSDISKLAEKFEIAQTAEAASQDKAAANNDKANELQAVSELTKKLPADLSQKFGDRLKNWESGKLS